jgi:hypothetical protein
MKRIAVANSLRTTEQSLSPLHPLYPQKNSPTKRRLPIEQIPRTQLNAVVHSSGPRNIIKASSMLDRITLS